MLGYTRVPVFRVPVVCFAPVESSMEEVGGGVLDISLGHYLYSKERDWGKYTYPFIVLSDQMRMVNVVICQM